MNSRYLLLVLVDEPIEDRRASPDMLNRTAATTPDSPRNLRSWLAWPTRRICMRPQPLSSSGRRLPYEASDPSLLPGVHATLLWSCRDAGKVFGTFLSGPGVLEARRRITLRMRAARLS